MAFKGENCKGGKKSKQRLTVLLCANSTGTDKLKPFVIGKYAKPRCFKNVKSLPVDYKANKRAWMTEEIFNKWLLDVDKEMKRKKKKIALLVDNCTPHNNPPNEFLNLDNDVLVFSGASDEEILAEVIPGDQSDEEEAADCSQNRTQNSPENAILLISTLQDFVATLPNVTDVHLNSLDGLKSMCMEMAIASKNKQTRLTDYFSK
nr:tigger transposable element-derived protein 6-like [Parasteatoda tepidariorum]